MNEKRCTPSRLVHRCTKKDISKPMEEVVKLYDVNKAQCMSELLWWSSRHGNEELCKELLAEPKQIFDDGGMAGVSYIHMVVYWRHTSLIPLFSKHGFNLDDGDDEYGLSPLFWAHFSDNVSSKQEVAECANILQHCGADVTNTTPYTASSAFVCEMTKDPNKTRFSKFCGDAGDARDALRWLDEEHKRSSQKRLKKNIEFWINFWLWKFSASKDSESVRFCESLIKERGADPTVPMFITSAFHRAARFGNYEVLGYLLERRKRWRGIVNSADQLGWTALHNAALNDQEACAKLLLDHGADWRIETREGSALDIAEEYNNKSVVKLFENAQTIANFDCNVGTSSRKRLRSHAYETLPKFAAKRCNTVFCSEDLTLEISGVRQGRVICFAHAYSSVDPEAVSRVSGSSFSVEDSDTVCFAEKAHITFK
ncbi:uncharacterized protein [Oscarella lobularis]|uniref:uncharacterized protein isoform X3 n=1 Tax=Oscarella lobularis TaxID=121494 RepID=UPI003313B05B